MQNEPIVVEFQTVVPKFPTAINHKPQKKVRIVCITAEATLDYNSEKLII
jgi:hypothetical protein